MGEVKYRSQVQIEQRTGLDRAAFLPPGGQVAMFGVHGPVAEHYGVDPDASEHPATLDYVVAATAGCLLGTLGVALAARRIDASGDRLTASAVGEVESEDGVLVIKRISVRYRLAVAEQDREAAERVHGLHATHCAVARSIAAAIAVTTDLECVVPTTTELGVA
jgi:organic hydroperoxide reductase OsmC/OhrA